MELHIVCIPGDGIGPEIIREAKKILEKTADVYGHKILFQDILMGGASIDVHGVPLTEEAVAHRIQEYSSLVQKYLYTLPDRTFARVTEEDYQILADHMAGEIEKNYEYYQESTQSVWPFHILSPERENGKILLNWEDGYLFEDGTVTYQVELSRDYSFRDCIVKTSIWENRYEAGELPAGQYFLRVRATGENGILQDAYEYYRTEEGSVCYSTLCFYIL